MVEASEMSGGERSMLSRKINAGIAITAEMKALEEQMKGIKEEIWAIVEHPSMGESVKIKSNKGLLEIRLSEVVSLVSDLKTRAALVQLVGPSLSDFVEEEMVLKPTEGFKRIVKDPNPAERDLSEKLRLLAKVREQVAFRFIGEG